MSSIKNIQSMLQDLIGSDKAKRTFAANFLSEIHFAKDSRIDDAMRAENFPINTYVINLINRMLLASKEHLAEIERELAELNSLSADELMQDHSEYSPETTEQHESLMANVTCTFVFEHLGESISSAKEEVIKMLHCNSNCLAVLGSIRNLGGKASIWAYWFFEALDGSQILNHDFFKAFASIARGDKATLSKLCDLTTSSENLKLIKVIRVLGEVGPLVKYDPRIVPFLRKLISLGSLRIANEEIDPTYVSILSLARITSGSEESVSILLSLSHSQNNYIKGMAISALEEVNYSSSEIVIRLGELFESFEEYDSDMAYEGEKSRVANAIEKQGSLAAPLVPKLITRIKDQFGEMDLSVVKALGAIGPKAIEALPHLKKLTKDFDDDDLADVTIPIIKAIRSIEA